MTAMMTLQRNPGPSRPKNGFADVLYNINVPTDFEDAFVRLNSALLSFTDLKDKVNAL
jgi:hypothetical protein